MIATLLAVALLRGALAFVPSMAAWGANLLRFVDPLLGAALWIVLMAAIVAPRMRPVDSGLRRIGDAVGARKAPFAAWAIAALAVAALVWVLPDRLQFTGDFRMREGALVADGATANAAAAARGVFPQAMPLDTFLHFDVARAVMATTGWSANATARALGAVAAAALAICALAFVRALKLRGSAAAAALAIVLGGGYLGLFTGYGKAFAELSVATVAVGAFGVHAVRHGSPKALLGMGVALALAFGLHRSGIALLPAALMVWWLAWRAHGGTTAWRASHASAASGASRASDARRPSGASRVTLVLAVVVPLVSGAILLPRAFAVARGDAAHFVPPEAAQLGAWGVPFAALEPARLLDLANLLVLLSPLVCAIPLLALGRPWSRPRSPEAWVLLALLMPLVLLMIAVHPKQGIPRDWDVFAPVGVAISLVAAWLCARVVAAANDARLARAMVASAIVPTLLWLGHGTDAARGLSRVEAFATEGPARHEAERATTWDFLATTYSSQNRWEDAARACQEAAACGRSARRLVQWGMVETMRLDYRRAQSLYEAALASNPDFMLAWLGLAATSSALGDTTQIKRAAQQIHRLEPNHPKLAEIERYLVRTRTQS